MNYILEAIPVAMGVLAGVITALKFIAPRTSNTVDDAVLARLETLENFVQQVLPFLPDAAKAALTPAVVPAPTPKQQP